MPNAIISSETTCDLSPELIAKYGIRMLPLYVTLGETSYKDGLEVHQQDLFNYFNEHGELPKTAAVTIQDFTDAFSVYRASGSEVVHIDISGEFSSCFQNARIAAEQVGGVYVVDSRSLSSGVGHFVLMGAELAQAGMCAKDIADALNAAVPRLEVSFVLDTLEYLKKGGRCSSLAALGASLLSLKPCIEVKNGAMGVGKKYRGTLKRCLTDYVHDRLDGRTDVDTHRIFITHSIGTDAELARHVRDVVAGIMDFDEILITDAGCTVSSHCGPNCLGILFFKKA